MRRIDASATANPSQAVSLTNHLNRITPRAFVRRHAQLTAIFAAGAFLFALLYLVFSHLGYVAEAKIYIPSPTLHAAIAASEGAPLSAGDSIDRDMFLAGQVQLIKSQSIIGHVREHLDDVSSLRTVRQYGGDLEKCLRENLDAAVMNHADTVQIAMRGASEQEAITLVNAVVKAYVRYQSTGQQTVANDLLAALRDNQNRALAQVKQIQAQIDDFATQNPNFNLETSASIVQSRLKTLSDQLTAAQLATMQAERAYAPGHLMRQCALYAETQVSDALQVAQREAMQLNQQAADFAKLKSALAEQTQFLQGLTVRIRELELQRDQQVITNDVQVIEPGRLFYKSLSSSPFSFVVMLTIIGGLGGVCFSIARQRYDTKLRSAEDVRRATGATILGVVPSMPARRSHVGRAMATHLDPRGMAAEAYRTVRTSLLIGSNRSTRTIMVTSAEAGDGKSVSATNLALSLTQSGKKVLLIDADMRRPTQHSNFDIAAARGLADVIQSPSSILFVIQDSGIGQLDVLPAGAAPINPSELLDSVEFSTILAQLSGRYDHIVIDTPPVNVVTDAAVVASKVDATVLVIRADRTTQDASRQAIETLIRAEANLAGVIVNDAPGGDEYGVYGAEYFTTSDTTLRHMPSALVKSREVPAL